MLTFQLSGSYVTPMYKTSGLETHKVQSKSIKNYYAHNMTLEL